MLSVGALLLAAVPVAGTPTDAAKLFYEAANQGRCQEAASLFTEESVATINRVLGSGDGFAQFCAGRAGRSPLVSVKVRVKMKTKDADRATVVTELSYEDGALTFETDAVVKRGQAWKLTVGEDALAKPERK